MKRATLTMTIAAAALLAAAATGSAATLKAEIPFAFDAVNARMQPGSYQVQLYRNSSATPIVYIYSNDDRRSALALPMVSSDSKKVGDPVLSFECTEGHCVLAKLWDGDGNMYKFAT